MFVKASSAEQSRVALVFVRQVGQCKGEILLICPAVRDNNLPYFIFGNGGAELACKPSERGQLAFPQDPVGFFCNDTQHTCHLAVVVFQGAVRKGMIRLLGETTPLQKEQQPFVPGRHSCIEYRLNPRPDLTPDLSPDLTSGAPQGPRVLFTKCDFSIGVVIEKYEFRSPCHPHREPRAEQNLYGGFKA